MDLLTLLVRLAIAVVIVVVIWKVGITMLRAASAGGGPREKIDPEDVEDLEVFFVCKECGTELKVTTLGKVQVPRHCGEPMEVVRRPRPGPSSA
ncbi:MAG: hypothetical protein WD004_08165 [Actinomycetota bacterium]